MKKRLFRLLSALLIVAMLLPLIPTLPGHTTTTEEPNMNTRKTPLMGWASWNAYRTNISEEAILSQADKLVSLGLRDLGYTYVNIDDGWQYGRGEDGLVKINETRFPSGMKSLADTLHAMGLKAGIYTDAGKTTCGCISDKESTNDDVGLYGHDEEDLNRYLVDWGYDFIKVDWCGGQALGLSQEERYTAIGKIIKKIEAATGEDKIYNICCWGFPGAWAVDCADSWRTGGDISNNFDSVLYQIDNIKSLAKYNGPGHVNDLDMMQIGNGMTYEEDKSHFAMWCMMSTPLMLGMDLNAISQETLSIISNQELIAVNQDVASIQATVAKTYGSVEAWTKDLGKVNSGKKAIAFLNRDNAEATVTVRFSELGLAGVQVIRDLWSHEDIATGDAFTVTIPAHGTAVLTAEGTPIILSDEVDGILTPDGSTPSAHMKLSNKPGTINLTGLGKYDWVHYATNTTKMKDGADEISMFYDGSYCTYGNAAATYRWTNADGAAKGGSSTNGVGVTGLGAYMMVSTPCDQNVRTLSVAIGSYSADMTVELIVGGKIIARETIRGGAHQKVDKLVTLTYSSDRPTTAYLRWTVTRSLGSDDSVNVEGVALSLDVKANTLSAPVLTTENEVLTASVRLSAVEKGKLYFATKDTSGALIDLACYDITEIGKSVVRKVTLDLPIDFKGKLEAYLWNEQNQVLSPMTEVVIDIAPLLRHQVGAMTAKSLIKKGAVLLDVRSAEEFEQGHLEGALHMAHTDILTKIETLVTNKEQAIVVYCSAAKKSAQAVETLVKLGYTKVYNLGSMQNFTAKPMITFTTDTCRVVTAGDSVKVSFTASPYDLPEVYISCGKASTLADAVLASEFRIPTLDCYYLTLKAYLVKDGVSYAETEEEFIYWSKETVSAFAADLAWSEATIGWGAIQKNRSVDGNKLTLAGKTFTNGIGTHATSKITMRLPEGARKFLAVVGCDLEKSGGEAMMFYVYIDGKEVAESSLIRIGQHFVFDIDIPENADEITLYVYEGANDGNTNDHADWCIAGFFEEVKSR